MRRVLIATGISATLLLGGAVAADAAPKNKACVTIDEFAQIKMGNSKAHVAKVFGTKGIRGAVGTDKDGHTTEVRSYKVCKMVAAKVSVTFSSGKDLPEESVGWSSAKAWVQRWEQPQTTTAQ